MESSHCAQFLKMAAKQKRADVPKVEAKKLPSQYKFKYWNELIVFLFAFLLYASCIPNDYNLDDELVTRQHRLTSQGISAIPEIFRSNYYQDESGYKYEYRPIVLVSFALEHEIFGDNPHVSHFFNVLLYALMCLLLWRVLKRLMVRYPPLLILFIMLLYIAHPSHTEVVDSIKNRDEILALGFGLSALLCSIQWLASGRWWFVMLAFLSASVALLSKSSVSAFCLAAPVLILFFNTINPARFATICLVFLMPIVAFSPFYSINIQVLFLIAGISLYIAFYSFKNFTLARLLETFNKSKPANGPPFQKPENIAVDVTPPIDSVSANTLYSKWIYPALIFLSFLLLVATWYLFLQMGIVAAILPVIVFAIAYLVSNDSLKQIIFPFWVIAVLPLVYLIQDRERIAGFALLIMVVLSGNMALRRYRNVLIGLFVLSFLCLLPYDDIKFFFLLLLLPTRWQKNKYLLVAGILLSILLIFKPILSIFLAGQPNDDLTLGLLLFWLVYFLSVKGMQTRRLLTALAIFLPVLLFIVGYDDQHNTLLIFKISPKGMYVDHKPLDIKLALNEKIHLFKVRLEGKSNEAQIAAQKTAEENIVALRSGANKINSGAKQIANQVVNLPTAAPVSATYDILSQAKRPVTYMEQPVTGADPILVRMATGLYLMGKYVKLSIIPYPLSFYYGYSEIRPMTLTDYQVILSALGLLLILVFGIYFFRKGELIGLAGVLFILLLLPFCSFFVPIAGTFADRFLFFPSLCISIGVIRIVFWGKDSGWYDLNLKWAQISTARRGVLLGIMLTYAGLTIARTANWKDHLTLYRHDISHVPNSAQAHNLLGLRLMTNSLETVNPAEQLDLRKEAIEHFRRSVEIYPAFFNTNYDLARTYVLINEPDSAIVWFKKSTFIDTTFTDAFFNVADLSLQLGRFDDAIPYFQTAIRQNPKDYEAYDRLSYIYFKRTQYDNALQLYRQAIAEPIGAEKPYVNIATIYQTMGQRDSAMLWAGKTLKLDQNNQAAKQILESIK